MRNFPMTQAALAAFLLTACGDDGRAPATAERNDAVPTIAVQFMFWIQIYPFARLAYPAKFMSEGFKLAGDI